MFKNLKKLVFEGKESIKFLSDFDLYASYEELVDQLMDTDIMVLDNFDYDHRDLNKRFVDLSVEAGVKKVYYLQFFADDRLMSEEQSQLEKYISDYPGLDASFISLPMSMESLYKKILDHESLPKKDYTVMAISDMESILKQVILLGDNNKVSYNIKGLAYEDEHDYRYVMDTGNNMPMKAFKSDLAPVTLTTWFEFVQDKKQA